MTTEPERLDRAPSGVDHERRLIHEAQRDISRAFPWVPVHQVSVLVECIWAEFDNATVRDFVPILVRKQAREELSDFHPEAIDIRTRWVAEASNGRGRRCGNAGSQGARESAPDVECG